MTGGRCAWAVLMLAGGAALPRLALGQSEPLKVITHTRAYCEQLSTRAADLQHHVASPDEEVALLLVEGEKLCAQGQIRPGIIRLRRAIMLMRAQTRQDPARQDKAEQ